MTEWIGVTGAASGAKATVRAASIEYFCEVAFEVENNVPEGTKANAVISTNNSTLFVRETPEEIARLIGIGR